MDPQKSVMSSWRIRSHPILAVSPAASVVFTWRGEALEARAGDTIAAALFANGVRVFGEHPRDGSRQGIFCANGHCSQCTVVANGLPIKACTTRIEPGMAIAPVCGFPRLPATVPVPAFRSIPTVDVACLIIGGGPAGLSAAIELGKRGIETLVVDDKSRPGGKLVLQTHRFFGSVQACYAGSRGVDIATRLAETVNQYSSVNIWLSTTAVAVFSDRKVGLVQNNKNYVLVAPRALLVASGAREKSLAFRGNGLPGVYGAGAFQTLLNGAQVRPAQRIFIVGGGNVGLIAAYHALQAGIEVVGLAEASCECGGYRVHRDKLVRMGVPIHTSHTVLSANGQGSVESITLARVDGQGDPMPGTQRSFACDTVLVAAGLVPANELYHKALDFGFAAFAAGDAGEVAEASAAMFSGKIRGLEMAWVVGQGVGAVPLAWRRTLAILKSRPGKTIRRARAERADVFPMMHCTQEIPCNPCAAVCPIGAIRIDEQDIRQVPAYIADQLGTVCIRCEKCVNVCPGLAITLVDRRGGSDQALVTVPHELGKAFIRKGDAVLAVDCVGEALGHFEVVRVRSGKAMERTVMVKLRVPSRVARAVAGIRVQSNAVTRALDYPVAHPLEDALVCRCERVTEHQIVRVIQSGVRDMNQLKALTRAGMGPCGGQTCQDLIRQLFVQQGVPLDEVTPPVQRPLSVEVALGLLAGAVD